MVNAIDLEGERIKRIESQDGRNSFASGGGPPHDSDMERRVAKLEDKMDGVQVTLNAIQVTLAEMRASMATKDDISSIRADLSPIRADISSIKASLEGKASASSVSELKGRIDSLPGIAKISAVVALIGAALKYFPGIFNH